MTNGWVDIKNADVVFVMGGNPAENHPCGFKWALEAKKTRGAKIVCVDPRFQRTAAVSDMAEPLRAVPARSTADPGILLAQRQEDLVVGDELVRFRYYTRVVHWGVALTFFICLFTGLPIWTPIFGWLATLFRSLAAQTGEDMVVGEEVVRFRYYTRVVHWGVALTFFLCLFTGLPIWTPIFGWLAPLFGGLQVCRWLHPWTGIAFSVFALLQFVHWAGAMKRTAADKRFTKLSNFLAYMRWEYHDDEVGKFNGGQKSLFWLSSLAALGVLASGMPGAACSVSPRGSTRSTPTGCSTRPSRNRPT